MSAVATWTAGGVTTGGTSADGATTPYARAGGPAPSGGVRWDRVLVGLLLAGLGAAWLLDGAGVAVGWSLLPAAGLVLAGVVLLLGLAGGTGRGTVAVLGIVLLGLSVAVGVGAGRFTGPVGDLTLVPGPADWAGGTTRLSAGTVVVDLTDATPPPTGRAAVEVGAGRVVVRLPEDVRVRVEATVVMGSVQVDGTKVQEGVDLAWTDPLADPDSGPVLTVAIATGDLEVRRGAS